jgi:threonine dehydrogenase-like Zn-dependent dehydrogenase
MMQAATLLGNSKSRVERVTIPPIGPTDVLVGIEGTGVCASNLPVWEGRSWFQYPAIPGAPGHEGWGVVECVGEAVTTITPGKRVAMLSSRAYAQYDAADQHSVVELPNELDGIPVPGEPLACAVNVHARAGIKPGMWVVVVGVGFLGAVVTHLAVLGGARVLALSRRAFARQLAERFGATVTVAMESVGETVDVVRAHVGPDLAPVVIEAAGTQASLDLATQLTAVHGRLVIAGYHQDGSRTVDMQQWNWKGLDVINAHERDPARYVSGMREGIALLRDGLLDLSPLLAHRFPLSQLDTAFRLSVERPDGFVKAIIDPWAHH